MLVSPDRRVYVVDRRIARPSCARRCCGPSTSRECCFPHTVQLCDTTAVCVQCGTRHRVVSTGNFRCTSTVRNASTIGESIYEATSTLTVSWSHSGAFGCEGPQMVADPLRSSTTINAALNHSYRLVRDAGEGLPVETFEGVWSAELAESSAYDDGDSFSSLLLRELTCPFQPAQFGQLPGWFATSVFNRLFNTATWQGTPNEAGIYPYPLPVWFIETAAGVLTVFPGDLYPNRNRENPCDPDVQSIQQTPESVAVAYVLGVGVIDLPSYRHSANVQHVPGRLVTYQSASTFPITTSVGANPNSDDSGQVNWSYQYSASIAELNDCVPDPCEQSRSTGWLFREALRRGGR